MTDKLRSLARFVKWLAGFPVIIAVVAFAVTNRQPAVLHWSPVNTPLEMPFCFFVLAALFTGMVLGGLLAWLNAATGRRERREQKRRIKNLEGQLKNAANLNTVRGNENFYDLPALPDKESNGAP